MCEGHVLPSVYFFFVLSVTRCRPLLGQVLVGTLNQENCNVSSESDSVGNRDF